MKKLFAFFLAFLFCNYSFADVIRGNIEKKGEKYQNKIVDTETKKAIPFALVKIPSKGYETRTDENGFFRLNIDISGASILSVEKEGYKPFSLTINKDNLYNPFIIGIEKNQMNDITVQKDVIHLGDNRFSQNSANSTEFQLHSSGPYYTKKFLIKSDVKNTNVYLVIGSIIGIDTLLAHNMGQSRVASTYASPPQIYFNGQKIAEININGDGQQILLPKQLLKENSYNEITLKTGKNLFQTAYIDYDDIEVANIHIKFESTIANNE